MPYILPERRGIVHIYSSGYPQTQIDPGEDEVSLIDIPQINSVGELNFAITQIIHDYWKNNPRYQTINDIVGALDCAKMEFYRRVAVPYENEKIEENGDVYGT